MTTIDFEKVYSYRGAPNYHLVDVTIRVFPPGGVPQTVNAFLDTGAEFSVFANWWAPVFGITDIPAGRREPVMTASGVKDDGFAFDIDIEFLGYQLNIPIVFVPAWPSGEPDPNILGMHGFFDKLVVAFEHQHRRLYIKV